MTRVGPRICPDVTPLLRIVRVHDLSVPGNLSRVSWKLSRTVLRGGTNSDVGPLLGQRFGAKEKQPFNFGLTNDSPFAFAGLWDRWRDRNNEAIETCTILTTKPNSLVADVHDRMPVMLRPEDYDLWLDPGITDSNRVVDCLMPLRPHDDEEISREHAREPPRERRSRVR